MSKLRGSLTAKIIAVVLLAASCLVLCGAAVGVSWLDSEGAYRGKSAESVREELIDRRLQNAGFELLESMQVMTVRSAYDSSVRFALLDENGTPLAGNLGESEAIQRTLTVPVDGYRGGLFFTGENRPLTAQNGLSWDYSPESGLNVRPEVTPTPAPTADPALRDGEETPTDEGTRVCSIRLYWTAASESAETDAKLRAYELLFPLRYALIGLGMAALLAAGLLFAFLMAAAGRHGAEGEVRAGFVEKLPFDLLLGLSAAGICLLLALVGASFNSRRLVMSLVLAALCLLGSGLLLLLCLMSFAVRLKLGTVLESCLVWRILRRGRRCLLSCVSTLRRLLRGLPLVWRWVPLYAALLLADFWLAFRFRRDTDMLFFVLLLRWALLGAAALYLALCLRRLREGAAAIAAGRESVVIETKYMRGDLRAQAEDLMHIRDGLSAAVTERLKSERLRTELITNVSHDIRTPLTSIVNYVDLLSREEPENEKSRAYLEVLQRQAAKLKKLIDDLIEASKAATGVLPVDKKRCELNVLLEQTAGEYGERLRDAGLELVTETPERTVAVLADGRHMWRVFENLMQNILKYALPGTRVYLSLEEREGEAVMTFRNISRERLSGSSDELLERFVRGDGARGGEGSGLGLSIAASLMQLQGGRLELSVDGDLFKVRLCLPRLPDAP